MVARPYAVPVLDHQQCSHGWMLSALPKLPVAASMTRSDAQVRGIGESIWLWLYGYIGLAIKTWLT